MEPRFDWYQATIRDLPTSFVVQGLQAEYAGSRAEVASPRPGYGEGWRIIDALGVRATVMGGGRNKHPNVAGTGQDGPGIASWLRAVHPDHEVTRLDSAVDFDGEGAWDQATRALFRVADRHGLVVSQEGDWRPGKGERGRTLYVGSAKSGVRALLYEKGKERRQRGDDSVPLGVVRLEARVRPKGEGPRKKAASIDAAAVFGMAKWLREAFELVTGFDVEQLRVRDYRESDDRRAIAWMATQYLRAADRLAARDPHGWAGFMSLVDAEFAAARAVARRASV